MRRRTQFILIRHPGCVSLCAQPGVGGCSRAEELGVGGEGCRNFNLTVRNLLGGQEWLVSPP